MSKNITINFSDEMLKHIDKLLKHYQKPSITTVNKTDLIRHLLKKEYQEVLKEED
jgi:hypothetical protein